MTAFRSTLIVGAAATLVIQGASATLVSLGSCGGLTAVPFDPPQTGPLPTECIIATDPSAIPNPVAANPDNGILLAWNEVQNLVLPEDLLVDRVFDPTASFVTAVEGGGYLIAAGTVVSSHYVQWDPVVPAAGSGISVLGNINTTITLDSEIFAFITEDANLFGSDALLGLPGLDYNDFTDRSLEGPEGNGGLPFADITTFAGNSVDISWWAFDPGDWTRLITAFSPGGGPVVNVPEPTTFSLLGAGLIGLLGLRSRPRRKRLPNNR